MELKSFNHFITYNPNAMHYIKREYDTGILASGKKISDIYYILNMGKINLDIYINNEYIKYYTEDELMNKFMKSMTLFNSLSYYNYALDHSWQVVYFYIGSQNNLELIYNNLYEKLSKNCTLNTVNTMLDFAKSIAEDDKKDTIEYLKNHIHDFFTTDNTEYIRELYNYLKHRGMVHSEGVGFNSNYLPISLGDKKLEQLYTREINPEYLFNELKTYHNNFISYMDEIINKIMPYEYTEKKSANLIDLFNFADEHSKIIKK